MPDANNIVDTPGPGNVSMVETPDASPEILTLLSKDDNGKHPLSDIPIQHAQETKAASPLPYPELPGLGTDWLPTTDPKVLDKKHKVFLDHTRLLSEGTAVEAIEHGTWGVWRGCQCADCKTKRNERRVQAAAGTGPLDSPKAVGAFLTEKFFGRVLCLPNDTMKAVCKFKHYPAEAAECWNVPADDIKVYEEFGKFLMENYLHLEDNKHAQLAAFSIWYLGKLAITGATMNAILSKEKK